MRVIVHDHAGHPFQPTLSRALAQRGHQVLHLHCPTFTSPKGRLQRATDDPPSLRFDTVAHRRSFQKYSYSRRIQQELQYGRRFGVRAAQFGPDVILSANTPLFSQAVIAAWAVSRRIPVVPWVQDIYSVAALEALRKLRWLPNRPAAMMLEGIEAWSLRQGAAIVTISEDFGARLMQWRVNEERVHVIENWAPLAELPLREKDNGWARSHGLHSRFVFLYSGLLGLKHDPQVLLDLASHWQSRQAVVVVVAEGPGADWLREEGKRQGVTNLVLLGFQPYEVHAEVLACADVLVAILTATAGHYSVPSKVLSYHCAARPILAMLPPSNQAARLINRVGSGITVGPGDMNSLLRASETLYTDGAMRGAQGGQARNHAESAFDVERITDRFEPILVAVTGGTMSATRRASQPTTP